MAKRKLYLSRRQKRHLLRDGRGVYLTRRQRNAIRYNRVSRRY